MNKKVITYIRVSTSKQGRSGLGQEAQVLAIDNFCSLIFPRFHGHIVKHSFSIHTASGSDYQ